MKKIKIILQYIILLIINKVNNLMYSPYDLIKKMMNKKLGYTADILSFSKYCITTWNGILCEKIESE